MKLTFGKKRAAKLFSASSLVIAILAGSTLANTTPQTLPYRQDWFDNGQITADNNWSGVPGIVGYGSIVNASPNEDGDPRTFTGESQTERVFANKSVANSTGTNVAGGVYEIDQSTVDPTIAFKGSGNAAANATNLVVNLNTSGITTGVVGVSYRARDLDSTVESVKPIAMQYRVGSSGPFINLPAGYIADATGPGATLVTIRTIALPAETLNQPLVQVRILSNNAGGTDELVGIDDINARNIAPSAATATIRGRVTTGNLSVARATVTLTNLATGDVRTTLTSGFGYYSFSDLEVGNLYTVSVASKKFGFAQVQPFSVNGDMSDVNLSLNDW